MKTKKLLSLLAGGAMLGCFLTSPTVLADSIQKAINVVTGISVYVNNTPLVATNSHGNPTSFYHNGTVYVDVQEVAAALGQKAAWNPQTKSYYISENSSQPTIIHPRQPRQHYTQSAAYILDVCPPYQLGPDYQKPETVTVAGKEYKKAFLLSGNDGRNWQHDAGWALYNLEGKYSVFSFDIGHRDGHAMHNGVLSIYLDGELAFKETLKAEMMPTHYDVRLNGAKQMKIIFSDSPCTGDGYPFLNATVR